MIEVLYAQIILDFVVELLSNDAYLNVLLIFLGGEAIALAISVVASIFITQKIKKTAILKSALLSFLSNLLVWFIVSFVVLFVLYPGIFENIVGYEILIIAPVLVMYLGIYVIGDITLVWIYSQISYSFIFCGFLFAFRNEQKARIYLEEKYPY